MLSHLSVFNRSKNFTCFPHFNGTGFERWNKIYSKSDEINTVQKNIRKGHQKTVDDVVSYIKNYPELTKKSYCDAGCGVGSLSIPLLKLGIKELQVSDISSEMIKETKTERYLMIVCDLYNVGIG